MGRKRIRDIRHEELIEATIAAVHARGYATVTMSEIAKRADSSAASISYYFGSKDGLMEATMRHLLQKLKKALITRLAQAHSPQERLYAILDANFDDSLFTVAQCSLWVQFWASAPYSPRLARLQQINRQRVQSNFRSELGKLLPPDQAEIARLALQSYMDGIWLDAAQSTTELDGAAMRKAARGVAALLLTSENPAAEQQ
jgi:TetR/AcrR family transcriptional repressor of bet genes